MLDDSPLRHAIAAAIVGLVAARIVLGEFTLWTVLAPLAFGVVVFFQARWALQRRK